MSNDGTALGDRMKAYEAATGSVLPRYLPYVVRVDVRAAHSLLRTADKPFDMRFVDHMGVVARRLCSEIQGAVFGYQQSDEISILACLYTDYAQEPWFGGRVQKIASVSAGIASVSLALERHLHDLPSTLAFDARVFALPNAVEVANYFAWRQRDAQRNAVSMAAQARFPHNTLQGKKREDMLTMLSAVDINFDDYPTSVRHGVLCVRDPLLGDWFTTGASVMDATPDGWLARAIPPLPSFETNTPSSGTVRQALEKYFPPEVVRDLERRP